MTHASYFPSSLSVNPENPHRPPRADGSCLSSRVMKVVLATFVSLVSFVFLPTFLAFGVTLISFTVVWLLSDSASPDNPPRHRPISQSTPNMNQNQTDSPPPLYRLQTSPLFARRDQNYDDDSFSLDGYNRSSFTVLKTRDKTSLEPMRRSELYSTSSSSLYPEKGARTSPPPEKKLKRHDVGGQTAAVSFAAPHPSPAPSFVSPNSDATSFASSSSVHPETGARTAPPPKERERERERHDARQATAVSFATSQPSQAPSFLSPNSDATSFVSSSSVRPETGARTSPPSEKKLKRHDVEGQTAPVSFTASQPNPVPSFASSSSVRPEKGDRTAPQPAENATRHTAGGQNPAVSFAAPQPSPAPSFVKPNSDAPSFVSSSSVRPETGARTAPQPAATRRTAGGQAAAPSFVASNPTQTPSFLKANSDAPSFVSSSSVLSEKGARTAPQPAGNTTRHTAGGQDPASSLPPSQSSQTRTRKKVGEQ